MATRSRKGYWRMSRNSIVQTALNNRWLREQGVPGLEAVFTILHYGPDARVGLEPPCTDPYARWGTRGWPSESVTGTRLASICHDNLAHDMPHSSIAIKYLLLNSRKVDLRQINHPNLPIVHGVKVIPSISEIRCGRDLRRTFNVAWNFL